MSTNPYERIGRLNKVHHLVNAIDQLARATGGWIDAHGDAHGIANVLRGWTAEQWACCAVLAGCRPPSAETRAAVVAVYRERAAEPSVEDSGEFPVAS